jgi:hypothetical protein
LDLVLGANFQPNLGRAKMKTVSQTREIRRTGTRVEIKLESDTGLAFVAEPMLESVDWFYRQH